MANAVEEGERRTEDGGLSAVAVVVVVAFKYCAATLIETRFVIDGDTIWRKEEWANDFRVAVRGPLTKLSRMVDVETRVLSNKMKITTNYFDLQE